MQLRHLDHFGIEVSDLARAEHFYCAVLGLRVVARMGDQLLLDCGGQNLALFRVARPALAPAARQARIARPLGQAHHAFTVSAEDFAAAAAALGAAGVESARPIDWGDHDCMYFLDPDGNLLELICYR